MATNLLSAAECKHATSNKARIRKIHDGDGLYLWIYLDGRKYWRMRYWQANKEKPLSLGVYPKVTLSKARQKHDEVRKQLQADLDPSAERKATNLRKKLASANSFEAVAMEWYNKQLHTWVAHHASDVKRRLQSNIFPTLSNVYGLGEDEKPFKPYIDNLKLFQDLLSLMRDIHGSGGYQLLIRSGRTMIYSGKIGIA